MQVLAVGNAAITPGGTTAATGSPVTRSGLSSPGLAAGWRLPGLAGLVGLTGSVALGVLAQRLRCHPPSPLVSQDPLGLCRRACQAGHDRPAGLYRQGVPAGLG